MARSVRHHEAEVWIGGIASMPAYITGEGEPHRPEILLWLDTRSGAIAGSLLGRPGELLCQAGDNLHAVMKAPMFGPPRVPARLRVASPELAEALRVAHPSIEVVCGPTPEVDQVVASMQDMMGDCQEGEGSFILPDIAPTAYASYFAATAALYRAKPWKVIPADEVVSVTIEAHGLDKAALSVIGQMGESFGFLLFSSMADFDSYLDAADAIDRHETPSFPAYRVLNFVRGAEIDADDRKTIASQHWPVATSQAYPWSALVDKDMVSRPLTADELLMMEVVAAGLTKLVGEKKAIRDAFADGGKPCVRTYSVKTDAGDIAVTFRVPHEERPDVAAADVLDALYDLEEKGTIRDEVARTPLEDELCEQLASSPEGQTLSELQGHRLLLTYAAEYVGASVATLQPWAVREVLFDIVPRKVSVDASAARAIVDDCRALYRFLGRAYGLEQAEECLQVLGPRAQKQLEKALSDPHNFGPAKAVFMAGKEAGFDLQSKEGIEAWLSALSSAGPQKVRPPRNRR